MFFIHLSLSFTYGQNPFITEWETTGSNQSITIPTTGGGYDYTVDWGDGTVESGFTGNATHTYVNPGTYQVEITGDFPRIYFNDSFVDEIKKITQWGDIEWTNMEAAFHGCYNLALLATDAPDLTMVTSTANMFRDCDLSDFGLDAFLNWDVSTVTNMSYMFSDDFHGGNVNFDLGNWDVSNVTDMSYMFEWSDVGTSSNIGDWNVSGVTTMKGMFLGGELGENLNNWNVSNVTDMSDMFANGVISFSVDLSNWDVSSVTDMSDMYGAFADTYFPDMSNWDVSNVTNMSGMLSAIEFNGDISNWDVSSVTDMSQLFYNAVNFNQDISAWDVSNVTDMSSMFDFAYSFNQDISNWDVGNVTDMSFMFASAWAFDQDISAWDVSSATTMAYMFRDATIFDQDLGGWDVSNVTNMHNMFDAYSGLSTANYDATLIGWASLPSLKSNVNFGGGTSTYCAYAERQLLIDTYNWNITDEGFASGCADAFITEWETTASNQSITIPTIGSGYDFMISWGDGTFETNTSGNPIHTYASPGVYEVMIFGDFPRIYFNDSFVDEIKKITNWGDIEWTNMEAAFHGCYNLALLATDAPDLTMVTSTANMFRDCDLSDFGLDAFLNWDVSTVTNMSYMFSDDFHGGNVNFDLGNWDVSNVTDMSYMFEWSDVGTSSNIGDWNVSGVTTMKGMFLGGELGENLNNWNVSNVTDMSDMFANGAISFSVDLSNWDVSSVTDMSDMYGAFADTYFPDMSNWDVSNVTNMSGMLSAIEFNGDISNWDVSSVTDMSQLFYNAVNFNQDISAWDVSNVTDMSSMFDFAYSFNQDISSWDVGNVTDMSYMFASAWAFDQDISAWDVSSATTMAYMFRDATIFDQDLGGWDVSNVTNMHNMFDAYSGLSTANYDATLIGWASLPSLKSNVNFGGGTSTYCTGAPDRCFLIDTYNWNITDNGLENGCSNLELTCPSDILVSTDSGLCTALVDYLVESTDACGDGTLTQTTGLPAGSDFPLGQTLNTFELSDGNGTTISCSFNITVEDNELPVFTLCPTDLVVNTDPESCDALVQFGTPAASDNCSAPIITQTGGLPNNDVFPIGSTMQVFEAVDAVGNMATCSFQITVNDTEAPAITCPQDVTFDSEPDYCVGLAVYSTPVGTDNCAGAITSQIAGLPSGSAFPVGVTTNTFEVMDAAGNTSNCSFTVTIIDTELPQISCPADIVVNNDPGLCEAVVNYTIPVGTDGCTDPTTIQTLGLASGASFPIGITTNTFEVSDAAGNTDHCSFTVTVNDVIPPAIFCPADIEVIATSAAGAVVNYPDLIVEENCTDYVSQFNGIASGEVFPIGTTLNSYTVTDASGNESFCSFIVDVVGVAPQISCPATITVPNTPGLCEAVVDFEAEESIAIPASVISYSHQPNTSFPVGTTTVSATATNAVGTSSCSFDIVVEDTELPLALCNNLTADLDAFGLVHINVNDVDAGSSDNCGIQNLVLNQYTFDETNIGDNQVTLTVTDVHNNASSCSAILTIHPAIIAFVWDDQNGDGKQDGQEPPIAGAMVDLIDNANGSVLQQLMTNVNGEAVFNASTIAPNQQLRLKFYEKANHRFTLKDKGGNDALDSDANRTTGLTGSFSIGSNGLTDKWDAGLWSPGTVEAYVWDDQNGNGVQDLSEPGLKYVPVELLDANGMVVASTTTNTLGQAMFTNVPANQPMRLRFQELTDYRFTLKDKGGDDELDSDANRTTGETGTFQANRGNQAHTKWDAGLWSPGHVEAYVWDDQNGNGVQDLGEPAIQGAKVDLLDADGNFLNTTTSNAMGLATFTGVPADRSLRLKFYELPGHRFTLKDKGGNDELDSDANRTSGETGTFKADQGDQTHFKWDCGLWSPGSVIANVWDDYNGNGVQESAEPGIQGVPVELRDANGGVLGTTITNAQGQAFFFGVPADQSVRLRFQEMTDHRFTLKDKGGDDALDSDANRTTGETELSRRIEEIKCIPNGMPVFGARV